MADMTKRDFFEAPQAAAVLKHGLLGRYLTTFASKVGKWSGGNVAYLDGFAGAGRYKGGQPGSPLIAVQVAEHLKTKRQLTCMFVERDRKTFDALNAAVGDAPNCIVRNGPVADHLDDFLTLAQGQPALAFFDPFGLQEPFADIARIMQRPGVISEVILNFSLKGLQRNAGKALGPTKSTHPAFLRGRETLAKRMDACFNGPWWRDVWLSNHPDRAERIHAQYLQLWRAVVGTGGYYTVPVQDSWGGKPVYTLDLISRSFQGLWWFNEALSLAQQDFYAETHPQGELEGVREADLLREDWERHIRGNIIKLVGQHRFFTVEERLAELLGEALGFARQTHIARVIKELHAAGQVEWDGVVRKADHKQFFQYSIRKPL